MNIPTMTYETICIHLDAETEFPKDLRQRVKDFGGKFSDIRGGTSIRFVTTAHVQQRIDAVRRWVETL